MTRPEPGSRAWAERFYPEFHWGDAPDALTATPMPKWPKPGEVVCQLGELVEVVYLTHKDGVRSEYVHAFKRSRPLLVFSREGDLIIARGKSRYRVTPAGIVG